MTLTKAELADLLFEKVGLNKREAKDMVDAFFEEIRNALETGDGVKLSGFGDVQWTQAFSNRTPDSNNGELWRQEASGARQTPDGGFVYLGAGHFYRDELPEKSYLLVKTGATGAIEWSKAYAPVNPYDADGDLCATNRPAALRVCRRARDAGAGRPCAESRRVPLH